MGAPSFVPSQPKSTLLRRFRHTVAAAIPFLVWIGGIVGVWALAQGRSIPLDFPGVAQVTSHAVVAPIGGRVETLLVSPRTPVQKGQLIGRMDGSHLELEARQLRIVIAELKAEMDRERALNDAAQEADRRKLDDDQRRFIRDLETARLEALATGADIEEARVEQAGLRFDLDRQQSLAAQELFSEAELIRTRTQFDRLGARLEQLGKILANQTARITAVEKRLEEFRERKNISGVDMDQVLGAFHWRITAQQTALELVALQRTQLELRTPAAGIVAAIHVPEGQYVAESGAVITIVEATPLEVTAYLPPAAAAAIRAGMTAQLSCSTRPWTKHQTTVVGVGPAVMELPPQILAVPGVPEWGVPVTLRLTSEMQALPGETVRVSIQPDANPL